MSARAVLLGALLGLVGCSAGDGRISDQLSKLVTDTKQTTIDISTLGPKDWDRMCLIGPYATNESTKNILGFDWDSERKSSIGGDDTIYVLAFVSGRDVLAFTEHPRGSGDFTDNPVACVSRMDAKFRKQGDSEGRIHLLHQPGPNKSLERTRDE